MKKIFLLLAIIIFVGCKKKDCVSWFNSEFEEIVIDTTNYINVSDLANKYNFKYEAAECDNLRLLDLLSIDGKEIKVYGSLCYNLSWSSHALYSFDNRQAQIPLDGHLLDTLPHDSTIYYVTGIASVFRYPTDMVFKKNSTNSERDTLVQLFLKPVKYTVKE